ncbi:MAG: tRNA guanosine(34) transglycosylase Tgt [Candidatus Pacebacteria bacterium]|nr:tRNA guanosine(34) transglycosylase Tgt [Candidatus Paceibacterota bacterium]
MIEFKILKKSKKSEARLGVLRTSHGLIKTPCFVPVATQACVKTLDSQEILETKSQILIANTFHLFFKPGDNLAKNLHKFMNWSKPLMTDSGGFQVFSLGFGKDFNFGKVNSERTDIIQKSYQPKSIKITNQGVWFSSPLDGKKFFMGPEESIKIQERLGADIIFAFDECTPPRASKEYIQESLIKTHNWARTCLKVKKSNQALFGIIQGSKYKDLRKQSAIFINSLDFDGFGIGGDLGEKKSITKNILKNTIPYLDFKKPRHLLGIGKLDDIENIIKGGIDFFDCTVPTHFARNGIAFIYSGYLDLRKRKFLKDKNPLDEKCSCFVCQNYKRNYISHLIRAKEITGLKLLSFHNLYLFNSFVEKTREKIKKGLI